MTVWRELVAYECRVCGEDCINAVDSKRAEDRTCATHTTETVAARRTRQLLADGGER